ncbi:hypothetical protein BO218_00415 [Microbacterium paludicola]|nr:hypothetical protein BO218_00415 [Microbacterium paludicola]
MSLIMTGDSDTVRRQDYNTIEYLVFRLLSIAFCARTRRRFDWLGRILVDIIYEREGIKRSQVIRIADHAGAAEHQPLEAAERRD